MADSLVQALDRAIGECDGSDSSSDHSWDFFRCKRVARCLEEDARRSQEEPGSSVRPRYLPVQQQQLCWRCGRSGHSRATCKGGYRLFCSRCGLVGVMSRDCSCGGESREVRPSSVAATVQTSRGVQCHFLAASVSRGTQWEPQPVSDQPTEDAGAKEM